MIIKNIHHPTNNFQKLQKKIIMPMVMASALITGAASIDKFEKQETQQNKSITNTKSPVEGLLTASVFGLMGLYDGRKSRSLINAIYNSRLEEAKVLLQYPDVDPNFQLESGDFALRIAVADQNVEAVKLLLKHPKINPNIKNNSDDSPLIKAINNNSSEIINELLKHPNTDPNITDRWGDTPLYTAVRQEKLELVKDLLKLPNINPNIKNRPGDLPLIRAMSNNNLELVKELLQSPNIDTNLQDKYGDTPLYVAVRRGEFDITKTLLKDSNLNPNIKNNQGDSPLIRALNENNIEIFKALLQHPNIDPNVQDRYGNTALVIATRRDKQEFLKELLKHDATQKNKLKTQPTQKKQDETFTDIKNLLASDQVKFWQGEYLNSTNFLQKAIDYLLENATAEEKQEIIALLKPLNNVSYNKTDENDISAIEKILNAEDFDLLELLKGKDLEYKRDFDYAFNRIENDEFKQEVVNLKFTFKDLEDAVNIQSLRAIDKYNYQFESPLFSATKNGKELWNSVCKHWDNKSFVLGFIEQYYKYCSE